MGYCKVGDVEDLFVSESSLLGFVGWLADMRGDGRRMVSHTSRIKYISGIKSGCNITATDVDTEACYKRL